MHVCAVYSFTPGFLQLFCSFRLILFLVKLLLGFVMAFSRSNFCSQFNFDVPWSGFMHLLYKKTEEFAFCLFCKCFFECIGNRTICSFDVILASATLQMNSP